MDRETFIERVRQQHLAEDLQQFDDRPLLGQPASHEAVMELSRQGAYPLDAGYCDLLSHCGYVIISPGAELLGIGEHVSTPWFSEDHHPTKGYWVVGEWGDGDQILCDDHGCYFLYLHENGPEFREIGPDVQALFEFAWR